VIRRKVWSKKPSPRFGARAGKRLRDPQRQRGLEVANFFIDEQTIVNNSSAAETQIYTHLASIAISMEVINDSPEQRLGTVLSSMQRSITLHGIVMDWGIRQNGYDGDNTPLVGKVWSCFQLASDRLAPQSDNVVVPASLGSYSPFQTQFPTAVLNTSTPDISANTMVNPTRVHWSRTDLHELIPRSVSDDADVLYVPNSQQVFTPRSTINRRLRIRLGDDMGFFLIWSFRTDAALSVSSTVARTFTRWARGQLYYRFVQ